MPKSFLFTHKRYDYDDYANNSSTQVKVEVDDHDMNGEEEQVDSPHERHPLGRNSSSDSSGDYSEGKTSLSPLPLVGRATVKSRLQAKINSHGTTRNGLVARHAVIPKKRGLLPPPETEAENEVKEESEETPALTSGFKKLLVSTTPSKHPGARVHSSDSHYYHRGNVIHYPEQPLKLHHAISPPCSIQTGSSYQIKLVSPPPGGTLSHHIGNGSHSGIKGSNKSREDLVKMETMTPSPLQFIIAAAEQQEQAEEKRMFMEGSRSETSGYYPRFHHPSHDDFHNIHAQQEQPVNLSVKKVDLFNLTQLAEVSVSIAAANREMMTSSSSSNGVSSTSSTTPTSAPYLDSSPSTGNGLGLMNDQSSLRSSPNHGGVKLVQQHHQSMANRVSKTVAPTATDKDEEVLVLPAAAKNVDHSPKRSGISEHANKSLIKTESKVGSKENVGKLMGKLKKPNSSSLVAVPSEKELRNDKNVESVLPSSNGTITSHNSCASVSSSTSSASSATSAAAVAASQRHRCVECGKGFSTLSNLARHRQTHRSLSDASAVKKCPHCDKVYVSMPAFSMHLRTHNQGCKCPYCGKGFSRPWLLQGHIRTHTGEKPFKCGICSKAFADKSNLRAHTQTHSTEKPFACQRCGKLFALKSYLCKHIESSCMKSNRPSGANGASGTGNGSITVTISPANNARKTQQQHHHHHSAINNSSSPVSPCVTRGTSPVRTTTMIISSPTSRDIRAAIPNATTTVTACSNNSTTTSSPSTNVGNNGNDDNNVIVCAPAANRKNVVALPKTTNLSILGISSHNNNNNDKINRASLKANDNNNARSSSGNGTTRSKNNCASQPVTSTERSGGGGNNKGYASRSSKIRKVDDLSA